MVRFGVFFLLFQSIWHLGWSQSFRLSGKKETFVEEVRQLATPPKQTPSPFFSRFDSTFQTIPESHQAQFIRAATTMGVKGYTLNHLLSLFELQLLVTQQTEWSTTSHEAFYSGLQEMTGALDSKSVLKACETLKLFLEKGQIYSSNFHQTYAIAKQVNLVFEKKPTIVFPSETPTATQSLDDLGLSDGWDDAVEDSWSKKLTPVDLRKVNQAIPALQGWILQLPKTQLALTSKTDSLILSETDLRLGLTQGLVVGKGGALQWQNAGLPNARATWNSVFSFKLFQPGLLIEDAQLVFSDVLKKPIQGIAEIRIVQRSPNSLPTFPRFKSYAGDAEVVNLPSSLRLKGGLALLGPRITTASLYDGLTQIQVTKQNQRLFQAKARYFDISDSLITSPKAQFTAYLQKDSVYHPAIRFRYSIDQSKIQLNIIESSGYKIAPFVDTFHQMYITCDAASWDLKSDKFHFYIISGKDIKPIVFESFNFYTPQRIYDLSTLAGFNPLIVAGNLINRNRQNSFTLEDIARATQKKPEQVAGGVGFATHQGLFQLDEEQNVLKLTPKGFHYLMAYQGRKDYDDLIIPSVYNGSDTTGHGIIDFKEAGLTINGTREFRLSDSLGIILYPANQKMEVKRSGTYTFDGLIKVKNYSFYGKNLLIDYDQFTVKLNQLDSITFIPNELYRRGSRVALGGNIRFPSGGMLYLNDPGNKSGKKQLPEFPRLVIPTETRVYFDERRPRKARYDRIVRFDIPSIDMDSLHAKDFLVRGTFHSGGIFPPFQEDLIVMPDTSIGFVHFPGSDAKKLYDLPSTFEFTTALEMDKRGLNASGRFRHLTGEYAVRDVLFTPSGIIAPGAQGKIKESVPNANVYFPEVNLQEYELSWKPKVDSLIIASKTDLAFYQNSTNLKGRLVIRSTGMFGQGRLTRKDSQTDSQEIQFNQTGFTADKSDFRVLAQESNAKPVFAGQYVLVQFDIQKQRAQIATKEEGFQTMRTSKMEFPYSAYETNIREALWMIDQQSIALNGDVKETIFKATNPRKEGLAFAANRAKYDIKALELQIEGIPFISTADVRVIPDQNRVIVKKEADMVPLKNATVVADTTNQYHTLTQASIDIFSKTKFTGDASYRFVSANLDTFQVKMGNFSLAQIQLPGRKTATNFMETTTARANVRDRDSLYLSPKMLYRGDIIMTAAYKNLTFDGFVIPVIKRYPNLGKYWIKYAGDKAETVRIQVDENLRTTESPLVAGLHFRSNSGTKLLYPTFLQPKNLEEDHDLFTAKGILSYNEMENSYDLVSQQNDVLAPRLYQLKEEQGEIHFENKVNLLSGADQVYAASAAKGILYLDSMKISMKTFSSLLFAIPPPALDYMAKDIITYNLERGSAESAIQPSDSTFQSLLSFMIGAKSTTEYVGKSLRQPIPLFKHAPKFGSTITLSDLDLTWNQTRSTFANAGSLGLSNIGENDINAQVTGYFEVVKNPVVGDELYLFIELGPDRWYYLGYKEGEPGMVSSDNGFNALFKTKEKGVKKGTVIPVDRSEALLFRKKFTETYLGIKPETPASKKPAQKKKAPVAEKKDGF